MTLARFWIRLRSISASSIDVHLKGMPTRYVTL
jgi:hypothetical protein